MNKLPISLVVITFNEEKNIERCLRSAPFVDDILVLDSGSTDRTVELARALGARVRIEAWRGFHKQKTRAVALALHQWVISLDADEALSDSAAKEIQKLVTENLLTCDGYDFPRLTYHLGRWIRHGGFYPDRQLRFFNREKCKWTEVEVHERLVGENVGHLQGEIFHWSFPNLAAQIDTINKYSSLSAEDFFVKNKKFHWYKLISKPLTKFIEKFFFKKGYRDGLPGFIIAVASSFSTFLRWAKLWEMTALHQNSPRLQKQSRSS